MALITDAINDALNEKVLILKLVLYAVPVFFCANAYVNDNMQFFYASLIPVVIYLLTLLSSGIASISSNKCEIFTLNIFSLIPTVIKLFIALTPQLLLLSFLGYMLTANIKIPTEITALPLVFKIVVWSFLFSIWFTSYLAFSKKLDIKNAYNLKIVSDSSVDVLVNMLFLIPQLCMVNGILAGFAWYVFFFFKIPINNPFFIFYCSMLVLLNILILSSYFAQLSYEIIKGKNEDYKDNYYIKGKNIEKQLHE